MDIISVTIGKPVVGYRSAAEALNGAANNPRQPRAKADGALLAGRQFIGGQGSSVRWGLEFTGHRWLDITCENDEVVWNIVDSPPVFSSADEYLLRWPSGAQSVIDAKRWLSVRADAEFSRLWVNEMSFYVYLRNKPILCFTAVRDAEAATGVLAVCEET
jgi:hypothetical protein